MPHIEIMAIPIVYDHGLRRLLEPLHSSHLCTRPFPASGSTSSSRSPILLAVSELFEDPVVRPLLAERLIQHVYLRRDVKRRAQDSKNIERSIYHGTSEEESCGRCLRSLFSSTASIPCINKHPATLMLNATTCNASDASIDSNSTAAS